MFRIMKSHHPTHARDPEPNVKSETEFFRHDHVDPSIVPPAPTTERELAAREAAAKSPAHVTRVDHAGPIGVPSPTMVSPVSPPAPLPAGMPAGMPGGLPHVAPPPIPVMQPVGPGGKEIERRNGINYIKGTNVVVGGPTQQ